MGWNWDAIGAIGEFSGALAVVLTLLFLSRQIREASRQLNLTSATETNNLFNDAFSPIYNNEHNLRIWVHGVRAPESLSEDDLEVFLLFMTRLMAVFDTVVEHHLLGTIGSERFQNYRNFVVQYLEAPGGKLWLEGEIYAFSEDSARILGLTQD